MFIIVLMLGKFDFLYKERRDIIGYILTIIMMYLFYNGNKQKINFKKIIYILLPLFALMVVLTLLVKFEVNQLSNILITENIIPIHNLLQNYLDFPIIYDDYIFISNSIIDNKVDLIYGQSFYKIFFWFIPRSLWLDKPWDTAQYFMTLFYTFNSIYDVFTSRPPSILGEWIWNFGTFSIPLLSAAIFSFSKFMLKIQNFNGLSISFVLITISFIGFVRGNFPVVLKELFIMYVIYKFFYFICIIINNRKKIQHRVLF